MPVAKVHICDDIDPQTCAELAREVRHTVVQCLELPPELGKVIVCPTPRYCRSVHQSRDPAFVLVEVHMFPGREQAKKNRLFQRLSEVIGRLMSLDQANIFVNIIETPRSDWGIRGGRPASEVDLGY